MATMLYPPELTSMAQRMDALNERVQRTQKEFQEFRAVVEERDKLKDKLWKERLVWIGLLVASWSGIITFLLSKML